MEISKFIKFAKKERLPCGNNYLICKNGDIETFTIFAGSWDVFKKTTPRSDNSEYRELRIEAEKQEKTLFEERL